MIGKNMRTAMQTGAANPQRGLNRFQLICGPGEPVTKSADPL